MSEQLREALADAFTYITQPRRSTRTEATYDTRNYNALAAKMLDALSQSRTLASQGPPEGRNRPEHLKSGGRHGT